MDIKSSPDFITELKPNQVFVFGSNLAGIHGAGAALQAIQFGAVRGVGVGLCGQTYAIPTKDKYINTLPLSGIRKYVDEFIRCALHSELEFLVTPIGCGLAGYEPKDIAPMFKDCLDLDNVFLPKGFLLVYKNTGLQS